VAFKITLCKVLSSKYEERACHVELRPSESSLKELLQSSDSSLQELLQKILTELTKFSLELDGGKVNA
jgi:hypothetical protein